MRSPIFTVIVLISVMSLAVPAKAQFQYDNVASDQYQNTAVGTEALFTLTPSEESSLGCTVSGQTCEGNTAIGYAALADNTTGFTNTAVGNSALAGNTGGFNNTAIGSSALGQNQGNYNSVLGYYAMNGFFGPVTGDYNTGVGAFALQNTTSGSFNTASGVAAMFANQTGSYNTASGYYALSLNSTGYENTASGTWALAANTTGYSNTASGYRALYSNKGGTYNTAAGNGALYSNTIGGSNTASGQGALRSNTTGNNNSATGFQSGYSNTSGDYNTSNGYNALHANTTGSSNIAEGYKAGYNLTTGNSNIDIGSEGVAADNQTIRIGTAQSRTFIAGINGVSVTGSAVMVNSNGQLGVTVSAEHFKTDVVPMGLDTANLVHLRPVSFRLKSDAKGTRQYGLIAEEVAKVYPELVIRDVSDRIQGVRYDEIAPMLLNEVQKQQRSIEAQAAEMRDLKLQVAELKILNQTMQVALRRLEARKEFVAQR